MKVSCISETVEVCYLKQCIPVHVGMDEMEFTEAESNMNDLISEYQQYQVNLLCVLFSNRSPLRSNCDFEF